MALLKTTVRQGKVSGVKGEDERISVFKGIPYAKAERFAEPEPADGWEGERICDAFSAICMQNQFLDVMPFSQFFIKEFYPERKPVSEDSLCLNIWTPAEKAEEKLPVMLWIHGGGFGSGYGHEMEFDGEALCRKGVVVVTVNYRLAFFGFFTHPELDKRNKDGLSGNYGILDQIAALKWVKQNIAAFGGDPDNVSIFGQSAGGMSVLAHLVSPLSEGLFEKAIVQSGGMCMNHSFELATKEAAQEIWAKLLENMGKSLDNILKMPAKELMDLVAHHERALQMRMPTLIIDNYVFPADIKEMVLSGKAKDMPVMIGSVNGDAVLIEGADGDKLGANIGDVLFAGGQEKHGYSAPYVYMFEAYIPGHDVYGFVPDGQAYHSSELWYIFGTLDRCWRDFDKNHYKLSEDMISYWTNFVKTGNPNGTGLAEWKLYTEKSPGILSMKETGCSLVSR